MISASFKIENSLWHSGFKNILGIDEVGRGAWAGPLVAAGVILPAQIKLPFQLADSKLLNHKKRTMLSEEIKKVAKFITIAKISNNKINQLGLKKAAEIIFRQITERAREKADFFLIDAFNIKNLEKNKQLAIIKGDQISASIAAASIIAKVYRDDLMLQMHKEFPDYFFSQNKGYGTKKHQHAIQQNGFCKFHRVSYNINYLTSE